MTNTGTATTRYSRGAIAFHWGIAALIVINLVFGLFGDAFSFPVMPLHKAIGITVLVLTLGRIGWRLAHPAPPPPADLPRWQQVAARATHFAFYGFMLAIPLTGWAMSSGPKARPLTWFGLFDIPHLPVSAATSKLGSEAHGLLAWGLIALLVLHVAAALRHHFLLRDDVLARMVPGLKVQENTRRA